MPEYTWMSQNKNDYEYPFGTKYAKILNMTKFWI